MTYTEAIEYLYNSAPLFQNIGAGAYKEGLQNTLKLDEHFGHPHQTFKTIHVAGTNGKGSVSHTIAAILQEAGYKVGLYTSPHLLDFRERIRVNGVMIPAERVAAFVQNEKDFFAPLHPSFFELTTALAFLYFREEQVDVAVIEVGLGGRLDCTNIITPDLSVITNISYDHTQFLGSTLPMIAKEKAGVIKPGIPVVIGETNEENEVNKIFMEKAETAHAPIVFADKNGEVLHTTYESNSCRTYQTKHYGTIKGTLGGNCQTKNTSTILSSIKILQESGYRITTSHVQTGFSDVVRLTGIMGRWQIIQEKPKVICDTGHNEAGITENITQLRQEQYHKLHVVIGMVSDKDINAVLSILPQNATYYFTQATVKRALPATELAKLAAEHGLHGLTYPHVHEAYLSALQTADKDDLIYVGGSNFIVADFLATQD